MKLTLLAALGAAMTVTSALNAQAPGIKLSVSKVNLEAQNTPQIQAANIVDKRWKPKTWLELDTEFDIKLPRTEGGEKGTYPALEFKYYLVLNASAKDGKRIMLTGTVNYQNIPADDKCHALAFVSPAVLKRALMKDQPASKADVVAFAVEIVAEGQVVGGKAEGPGAGKWWEDATKFSTIDGAVTGKDKTPFNVFWGDYDVVPQSK
jgi:hypothetical protein